MRKTKFKSAKDIFYLLLFTFPLVFLSACSSDDDADSPKPDGDKSETAHVINVTDSTESGIKVISMESGGIMTISATEDKVPQVGDYLCSGPTDIAPYGFRVRVTEVTRVSSDAKTRSLDDWKTAFWVLKTSASAINEIIGNLKIDYSVPLKDLKVDNVYDAEGNVLSFVEEKNKEWKIPIPKLNLGKNLSVTPNVVLKPQSLVLHLELKDKEFKKFGADFDMDVDLSVQVDASVTAPFSKQITLYYVLFKPIPICEVPPLALTPLFQVYLSFDAQGKATLSCVPVRTTYNLKGGATYDFEQQKMIPAVGDKWYQMNEKKKQGGTMNKIETGLCFNGSVSASVGASLSVGIDGCNYINRVDFIHGSLIDCFADWLSVDVWADLTRKVSATLSADNIDMRNMGDFHFNDQCDVENFFKLHLKFNCRIWNPFKGKFVGFEPEFEPVEIHFWEDDLFPSLFVSEYKQFTAKMSGGNLLLNAMRYKPYFPNSLVKENSYGFRYGKYINDDVKVKDWNTVSFSKVIGNDDDPVNNVESSIPMSSLEKGAKYMICPYIYGMAPSGSYYYFHRKGITIRINDDGNVTYNELPDIPGYDIN